MKTLMKSSVKATLVAVFALVAACDEDPAQPPLGSVTITATGLGPLSSANAAVGFPTVDGWNVTYTKFLVSMTQLNVAGSDGVVTASNTAQVFNAVNATQLSLVSADNRIARAWQNVNFEVGAATSDSAPIAPVVQADVDMLVANGLSVYVEATMKKDATTKTLQLGFTSDTSYAQCGGGVVIPKGGTATGDIGFAGDVLFADAIVGAHSFRGDPVANADNNNDGVVTLAEMNAVSILTARASGGAYTTGGPDAATLGAFVALEVPAIVQSFNSGTCTIVPPDADAGAQ